MTRLWEKDRVCVGIFYQTEFPYQDCHISYKELHIFLQEKNSYQTPCQIPLFHVLFHADDWFKRNVCFMAILVVVLIVLMLFGKAINLLFHIFTRKKPLYFNKFTSLQLWRWTFSESEWFCFCRYLHLIVLAENLSTNFLVWFRFDFD